MNIYIVLLLVFLLPADVISIALRGRFFGQDSKLRMLLTCGVFALAQMVFAFLGHLLGGVVAPLFGVVVAPVAFLILVMMGAKQIISIKDSPAANQDYVLFDNKILTGVALASGIRTMLVFMAVGLMGTQVKMAVIVLGLVTFCAVWFGLYAPRKLRNTLTIKWVNFIAGAGMIVIGGSLLLLFLF